MLQAIAYETDGRVATITLRRPKVRNALNADMLGELRGAFERAELDQGIGAVVLTGDGPSFCAGQDVRTFQRALEAGEIPDVRRLLDETYHPLIRKIYNMPKPVIAAVNGAAAGAGMSLALACDLRILAEDAFFTMGFIRLGLVPDSGITFFLTRLVGPARAFELAATGRRIEASEAWQLGLANRVVPPDALLSAATELAQRLAHGPTRAIGWTKQLLHQAAHLDMETALQAEAAMQARAISTTEHRDGVRAFLEKRGKE